MAAYYSIPSTDGPRQATAEDSVGDNTGVLTGFADTVTPWSTDVPDVSNVAGGLSLDLNGSSDYLALTPTVYTDEFVLMTWCKPDSLLAQGTLFGNTADANADGIAIDTNGKIVLTVGGSSTVISTTALIAGAWTHVGVSRDASDNITCYIDGVDDTTGTPSQAGTLTIDVIGTTHSTPQDFFDGHLDDARAQTTEISAADIALLVSGVEPATAPDNQWPFDDGPQTGTPQDGDPIATWTSRDGSRYNLAQATASKRLTLSVDANTRRWLEGDGTQYLKLASAPLTGTATSFFVVIDGITQTGTQILFSTSDEAGAVKYFAVAVVADKIVVYQYDGTTLMTLTGTTALGGTAHVIGIFSDGTTTTCTLDGAAEAWASGADTGNTWGDAAGRDNTIVMALEHTSVTGEATGKQSRILAYERELTDTEKAGVSAKLARIYGT